MMDWDAWEPQAPPHGFAEAVASAAKEERGKRRRGVRGRLFRASAWLAFAAAIGTSVVLGLHARGPAPGDVRAESVRREAAIGAHGQGVLEPGAHVAWNGDEVTQDKGDVFYRVEPGRTVRVHTPVADVEVNGACVRVKVRKVFPEGGVDSLTNAFVAVYEGSAAVSHEHERAELVAGEAAVATAKVVRHTLGGAAGEALFDKDLEFTAGVADAGPAKAPDPYDVTPDRWADLAKAGKVEYFLPWCSSAKAWTPKPEYLARLGLQPEDGPVLAAAYANSRARVWAAAKPLCAPLVGGGEGAEKLGPKTCIKLILENANNTDPSIIEDGSRFVALLGDGQRPPLDPSEPIDPVTKLLLVLFEELPTYETELASKLGMDDARRITRGPDGCHWQEDITRFGYATPGK